jgi:hypothetical protein
VQLNHAHSASSDRRPIKALHPATPLLKPTTILSPSPCQPPLQSWISICLRYNQSTVQPLYPTTIFKPLTITLPTPPFSFLVYTSLIPRPSLPVLGLPPRWSPPVSPRPLNPPAVTTLRQDRYPFLPTLLALLAQNPSFTLTSPAAPAIITSRKTFLSLYMLLTTRQPQRTVFTCNVVGKTVFLRQKDGVVSEEETFAREFGEEYTTWERPMAGSTGHYRVAGYEFGGIRCAVEFECGGYLPSKVSSGGGSGRGSGQTKDADTRMYCRPPAAPN